MNYSSTDNMASNVITLMQYLDALNKSNTKHSFSVIKKYKSKVAFKKFISDIADTMYSICTPGNMYSFIGFVKLYDLAIKKCGVINPIDYIIIKYPDSVSGSSIFITTVDDCEITVELITDPILNRDELLVSLSYENREDKFVISSSITKYIDETMNDRHKYLMNYFLIVLQRYIVDAGNILLELYMTMGIS